MKLLAALATLLCAALRAGTARAQLVQMYVCEDANGDVNFVWEGTITTLDGLQQVSGATGAAAIAAGQELQVGDVHQLSVFAGSWQQWESDSSADAADFSGTVVLSDNTSINRHPTTPANGAGQSSMGIVKRASSLIYLPQSFTAPGSIEGNVVAPGQTFESLQLIDGETSTVTWGATSGVQTYQITTNRAACLQSAAPSLTPSLSPSDVPSVVPSDVPSLMPSTTPSLLPSATPSLSLMPSYACEDTCMLPSKGKGGRSVRHRGTKGSKGKNDDDESAAPSASPGVIVCVFSPGSPSGKGGKGRRDVGRELRTHSSAGKGSGPFLETRCVASTTDLLADETFVNCGCCAVEVPDLGEVCVDDTCSATPELT
jgi:hypothetical protein